MERNHVISAIWALGNQQGMDSEDIHAVVMREIGKDSMRKCTDKQLERVLAAMKLINGLEEQRKGGITSRQLQYISVLEQELHWEDNPDRLNGFVKKMTGVEHVKWLSLRQASAVIEGLKKMIERQSKEESHNAGE